VQPSTRSTTPRRRRRSRLAAAAALLLLAEAGIAVTGQAAAAPTQERSNESAKVSQPSKAEILKADMQWAARHAKGSKAWALGEAKKTGEKVVAYDETTATSYTVANPDGTLTTDLTSGPERVWRGGKWRTVDVTLTRAGDGTVKAREHPNGLRLAGKGGTVPRSLAAAQDATPRDLVTLGSDDQAVTLQWKGGLPAPELDGTTARYRDAVPGADVIVEATRTGFEQYVEIAKRPSGSSSYTLPVKAKGLKAKADKDGSVTFTDTGTGQRRATMPAPVMWDASVDKQSGEHTRRARVDMKVVNKGAGHVDLVVTPSADFLADPKTQYPVTVDPSTSALASTFDTYVQRGETVDWSADTELDFGNPGTTNPDGKGPRHRHGSLTGCQPSHSSSVLSPDKSSHRNAPSRRHGHLCEGGSPSPSSSPRPASSAAAISSSHCGRGVPSGVNASSRFQSATCPAVAAEGVASTKNPVMPSGSNMANGIHWPV
jgi:hypothetical protein